MNLKSANTNEQASPGSADRLLCVDLDRTLIKSNLLLESFLLLAGQNPWAVMQTPFWLLKGRAYLKRRIAERVELDVNTLPYREAILEYVRAEEKTGRRIILATASDRKLARAVSEHLRLFDEVIGSDGHTNCRGETKLVAIRQSNEQPFDYMGGSEADLPLFEAASLAILVNPNGSLARKVERARTAVHIIRCPKPGLSPILKLVRPEQWTKNLLLFVPLILGHQLGDLVKVLSLTIAFVAFSCISSATYVLNDLLDIQSDRRHPRKRKRPLAAATVSWRSAMLVLLALLVTGFALAGTQMPSAFTGILAFYMALTLGYSFYLKRKLFIDVLVLAGLYTCRIEAGSLASSVLVSHWLLMFSVFFFLSIAFAKRYCELIEAPQPEGKNPRRNYRPTDADFIRGIGSTSGFVAVLVIALYINDENASALYSHPRYLWALCPLLLYWIVRMWFRAHRQELHDDPLLFATRDHVSYLVGVCCLVVLVLAAV